MEINLVCPTICNTVLFAEPVPSPVIDLVVDHHRGLLYSLSADGAIRLFRIGGPDGHIDDALLLLATSGAGAAVMGGTARAAGDAVGSSSSSSGQLPPPARITTFTLTAEVLDVEAACKAFAADPRSSPLNRCVAASTSVVLTLCLFICHI